TAPRTSAALSSSARRPRSAPCRSASPETAPSPAGPGRGSVRSARPSEALLFPCDGAASTSIPDGDVLEDFFQADFIRMDEVPHVRRLTSDAVRIQAADDRGSLLRRDGANALFHRDEAVPVRRAHAAFPVRGVERRDGDRDLSAFLFEEREENAERFEALGIDRPRGTLAHLRRSL